MPNVLVRDLSDEVHQGLQRRAEAEGTSLQQYLSKELTKLAHSPTLSDVLNQINRRRGGKVGFDTAVRDLDEERGRS
jgi:plasmid stability protein